MKYFQYFILAAILVQLACGGSTVPATSTTVPVTNTPEPTQTPKPTETSTPTATPNITATVAARATESAGSVMAELEDIFGDTDEIPYTNGRLAWQQASPTTINMSGPQNNTYKPLDKKLTAKNFIFKTDVTWVSGGLIVCGLAFRSEENLDRGKQYLLYFFRFIGAPVYLIDVFEFGQIKNSITKVQYASGLDSDNDATNQFILVAMDEQFIVYVNGERQGRYFDTSKQRMDGYFGFMAAQESREGSCKFEDSWVWTLE